ncbi:MAG: ABC transporter permease, partial [Actinobacteria bacterium]|nr:ABC transporter permease [Actinomycetota bacterium]
MLRLSRGARLMLLAIIAVILLFMYIPL